MATFYDKRVAAAQELSLYASGEYPSSEPNFFTTGVPAAAAWNNQPKPNKPVDETTAVTNMR